VQKTVLQEVVEPQKVIIREGEELYIQPVEQAEVVVVAVEEPGVKVETMEATEAQES